VVLLIVDEKRVGRFAARCWNQLEIETILGNRLPGGDQAIRLSIELLGAAAEEIFEWRLIFARTLELLGKTDAGDDGGARLPHRGQAANVVPVTVRQDDVLDRSLRDLSQGRHGVPDGLLGGTGIDRHHEGTTDDKGEVREVEPFRDVNAFGLADELL